MSQPVSDPELLIPEEELNQALDDWRIDVQDTVYRLLDLWTGLNRKAILILDEMLDDVADAAVYGGYQDRIRAIAVLTKQIETGTVTTQRIIGQFDSPAQVTRMRTEGTKGAKKAHEVELEKLPPVDREKLITALRGIVEDTKRLILSERRESGS